MGSISLLPDQPAPMCVGKRLGEAERGRLTLTLSSLSCSRRARMGTGQSGKKKAGGRLRI
jgi:hypothetical protein